MSANKSIVYIDRAINIIGPSTHVLAGGAKSFWECRTFGADIGHFNIKIIKHLIIII